MTDHVAAANDTRLAEHGAVEVVGSEPPLPCVAERLEQAKRGMVELRRMCAELDEMFERWNQEEPCSKKP